MDNTLQPQESLAEYVKIMRISLSLSQTELALKVEIHLQSLGKIERGMTTKLNSKSQRGLAVALQVPSEYLDGVVRRIALGASDKFCQITLLVGLIDFMISVLDVCVSLSFTLSG